MKALPLNLLDLVPKESSFQLQGKTVWLKPWSLRVRTWAQNKYGTKELEQIFHKQKISEIADIAFFMLKDPTQFKSQDDFLDSIQSVQEQLDLAKALLGAVGIGEPEFEKIEAAIKKDEIKSGATPDPLVESPELPIGAKPSTP